MGCRWTSTRSGRGWSGSGWAAEGAASPLSSYGLFATRTWCDADAGSPWTRTHKKGSGMSGASREESWKGAAAPYAEPGVGRSVLDLATSLVPYLALSVLMYLALDVSYLL